MKKNLGRGCLRYPGMMRVGVYIEELEKAIQARGLEVPPFYGLALDDESVDLEKIIADFRTFIQSVCQ